MANDYLDYASADNAALLEEEERKRREAEEAASGAPDLAKISPEYEPAPGPGYFDKMASAYGKMTGMGNVSPNNTFAGYKQQPDSQSGMTSISPDPRVSQQGFMTGASPGQPPVSAVVPQPDVATGDVTGAVPAGSYAAAVGRTEGGAAEYDAIFGYGNKGGDPSIAASTGGRNLSQLSIGEALGIGDSRMGNNAGAMGKYGFMPNTLRGLLPQAGLSPQDSFSPENQEKLFQALTASNGAILKNQGIEPTDKNLMVAHQVGPGGAAKLLDPANSDKIAADVLGLTGAGRTTNPHLNVPVSQYLAGVDTKLAGSGQTNYGGDNAPAQEPSIIKGNSINVLSDPHASVEQLASVISDPNEDSLVKRIALEKLERNIGFTREGKKVAEIINNPTPKNQQIMADALKKDRPEGSMLRAIGLSMLGMKELAAAEFEKLSVGTTNHEVTIDGRQAMVELGHKGKAINGVYADGSKVPLEQLSKISQLMGGGKNIHQSPTERVLPNGRKFILQTSAGGDPIYRPLDGGAPPTADEQKQLQMLGVGGTLDQQRETKRVQGIDGVNLALQKGQIKQAQELLTSMAKDGSIDAPMMNYFSAEIFKGTKMLPGGSIDFSKVPSAAGSFTPPSGQGTGGAPPGQRSGGGGSGAGSNVGGSGDGLGGTPDSNVSVPTGQAIGSVNPNVPEQSGIDVKKPGASYGNIGTWNSNGTLDPRPKNLNERNDVYKSTVLDPANEINKQIAVGSIKTTQEIFKAGEIAKIDLNTHEARGKIDEIQNIRKLDRDSRVEAYKKFNEGLIASTGKGMSMKDMGINPDGTVVDAKQTMIPVKMPDGTTKQMSLDELQHFNKGEELRQASGIKVGEKEDLNRLETNQKLETGLNEALRVAAPTLATITRLETSIANNPDLYGKLTQAPGWKTFITAQSDEKKREALTNTFNYLKIPPEQQAQLANDMMDFNKLQVAAISGSGLSTQLMNSNNEGKRITGTVASIEDPAKAIEASLIFNRAEVDWKRAKADAWQAEKKTNSKSSFTEFENKFDGPNGSGAQIFGAANKRIEDTLRPKKKEDVAPAASDFKVIRGDSGFTLKGVQ